MKKSALFILIFITCYLSSCSVIADIFKAGVGVGVFLVVLAIAVIAFIASKARGK